MLLDEVARTSLAVASEARRLAKIDLLASCLAGLSPEEVPIAVAYLSGDLPQGSIGVGWASLKDLPKPAGEPSTLELLDVDAAVSRIAAIGGAGSKAARQRELTGLFGRATEREQRFLRQMMLGELRQGALEGVMAEALARATKLPPAEIRRAVMLAGNLGTAGAAALAEGRAGLARFHLTPLQPVQPMLAQSAPNVREGLERVGPAAVEWKLDGARIQAHRLDDEVRVFSRTLADITDRVPEAAEALRSLPVDAIVLDGEIIALLEDGRPHRFQVTMGRFGSKIDVAALRRTTSLSPFFFDCIHLDGSDLIDRPAKDRFEALARVVPKKMLIPRTIVDEPLEADAFLDDAIRRGHEGVMLKGLDAPYEAGRRGASWVKVKRAHTLDLVVLGAEWGHGRRTGKLSNLHLGAREPQSGVFLMLGKTFKGLTDELLAWQTERLLELETHRSGITVFVRPELVVEVAFDGVQRSTRYPGGVALRFARVKGYRPDKRPQDADVIDTVRAIHDGASYP
jgi:DNA ligase-1